ncbi:hypothetical protein PAECIP111893_04167 [Paenibacillus plantiphilus]|uniref:N-acetyltransferase domain-containing protein n=1 Tax=Paenibacillus plantiphilus TaxID=2905650 RepID=A0ABM9CMJ6_9BACL|nr:GNAT family N-acetyltransferase [Paenibacillus plantiphilus]CAH1216774.1 hypothetical protein PAECIP111893_04167 [Paenibacillus plantiphilus]
MNTNKIKKAGWRLDLRIARIPQEDKETLHHLMQFYMYDFSEFMDAHVEDDGLYRKYPNLDDYWVEVNNRFPYMIKLEGKLAGFVLVRYIESEDRAAYFSIAEFFVMKKYRRLGLGKAAAIQVFEAHRGKWEVFQLESNVPAQLFWTDVIKQYTSGSFTDRMEQAKRIQEFIS